MPSDEKKGIGPPKCKVCGGRHWGRDPHVFRAKRHKPAAKPKRKRKVNRRGKSTAKTTT